MDKSPDAFRTISEVADELDVPQHVLRFWESKFHQIKPLKRGGGRRYYRPSDVDLVSGIKQLLYGEGYTIKGVQKILKEQGVAHVQAVSRGEVGDETAQEPAQPAPAKAVEPAPKPPQAEPAKSAPKPVPERSAPAVEAAKPAQAAGQGGGKLDNNQLRMLKAVLFEMSELKLLFESAPEFPSPRGDE